MLIIICRLSEKDICGWVGILFVNFMVFINPPYRHKLHPVIKAQFSTIEVLVAMPMTRWLFRIVSCIAGGNASATCLRCVLPMCNDCAYEFVLHFLAQYKWLALLLLLLLFSPGSQGVVLYTRTSPQNCLTTNILQVVLQDIWRVSYIIWRVRDSSDGDVDVLILFNAVVK